MGGRRGVLLVCLRGCCYGCIVVAGSCHTHMELGCGQTSDLTIFVAPYACGLSWLGNSQDILAELLTPSRVMRRPGRAQEEGRRGVAVVDCGCTVWSRHPSCRECL